jgi:hypothetical protein
MKNLIVMALIVFFLLVPYSEWVISEVRNNPNALRGIEEIDVIVHRLDSRLENSGYNQEQIKADVESKLGMAIIKVVPKALPTLLLDIKSYGFPKYGGIVVITVRLDLYQFVDLSLSQQILWTSTWSAESVMVSDAPNISSLRELIADLLNKFIKDYISVNPKK